jgi:3-hydroxyacyl-CoA dehydrogenase
VLTGGERANGTDPVDEQYLLDLEREVFVSLAGESLSQDRMAHMLKTGKPLRN